MVYGIYFHAENAENNESAKRKREGYLGKSLSDLCGRKVLRLIRE